MRVVLDTNVLLSALLWRGETSRLFALAKSKKLTLCVSRDTADEFLGVLNRPKFRSVLLSIGKTPHGIVDEFLEVAVYYPGERFPVAAVIEDPKDDMFLACALASQASFVVSGDRHLLKLGSYGGIPIVTPVEFLQRINDQNF